MATLKTDTARPARMDVLGAVYDMALASHARTVAFLVIVALAALLPGQFSVPPVDRDEARFAQASKQMVETGDLIDIRFQDESRYKKPVGVYWLQAAVVNAADALGKRNALGTIGLYRVPSLLGAIGAVLLTYWTALAFVSRRAAMFAALMIATSLLLAGEARLAKTDAVLLPAVIAAMGAMARLYLEDERPVPVRSGWLWPAVFWTALAIGMLIKGPVILLIVLATIITLAVVDRSARWLMRLQPLPGLLWCAALTLPWFIAIMNSSEGAFASHSIMRDLLPKLYSSHEGHGAPPGYYFLLFWVMFWPGAALAAMAGPAIWASRQEKGARFLLCWLVPAWIILELVITKLPHYVLPLYPAIAILIAGVLDSHRLTQKNWLGYGAAWWFVLPILIVGVLIAGLAMFGRQPGVMAWPFAIGALIVGLLAWRLFEADGAVRSLRRAMLASILLTTATFGFAVPAMSSLFPSLPVARALRGAGCAQPLAAAAGYHEPSLVFLAGTETRLLDGAGAAEFLRAGGCRFALIEARQERNFLRRADAIGLRYSSGQRIEGYNFSSGRWVSIAIYRADGS